MKYIKIIFFSKTILLFITILIIIISTGCSIDSKIDRGYKYIKDNKHEKAISVFEKILETDKENLMAAIGLSKTYKDLKNFREAEKYVREAIEIDKTNIESWKLLLQIFKDAEKDNNEIIDLYSEAYNKTEKEQFIEDLDDYLQEIKEEKYKETVSLIDSMNLQGNLLIKYPQNVPTILYEQTYEFNNNQSLYIDLNNDGREERIEVGMDSPNGMKVLVVEDRHGHNLLYSITPSSFPLFGEFGELLENHYIQVAFVDFNDDDNLEIIIAIGDKKSKLAVSVIENKLSAEYSSPYIEIGYFEGEDYIYLSSDQAITVPIHTNKTINEYRYNPSIGIVTNEENSGIYIFVDELVNFYDPNSSQNTIKKGNYVYLENEDEMIQFLHDNKWVYENDINFFLEFKENLMTLGSMGDWDVWVIDITEINLVEKYIIVHILSEQSFSDNNLTDGHVKVIDANVKFVLGEGPLQLIYKYDIDGEQIHSNWLVKN